MIQFCYTNLNMHTLPYLPSVSQQNGNSNLKDRKMTQIMMSPAVPWRITAIFHRWYFDVPTKALFAVCQKSPDYINDGGTAVAQCLTFRPLMSSIADVPLTSKVAFYIFIQQI